MASANLWADYPLNAVFAATGYNLRCLLRAITDGRTKPVWYGGQGLSTASAAQPVIPPCVGLRQFRRADGVYSRLYTGGKLMDGTINSPIGWARACKLAGESSIAAVLLLLGAGILLGLFHTAGDVLVLLQQSTSAHSMLHWAIATFLVGGVFFVAFRLARRPEPVPTWWFLGGLIGATLLLRTLLITTVEPTWSTDYLRYWQRAVEMAANGDASANSTYQRRALLVPYPVELIFGPDARTALKWTNALLLLLIQLTTYDIMRMSRSHQAAQAASLVLLASPLPAYAALIPSHDLWALVFLACSLWAITRALHLPRSDYPRTVSAVVALAFLFALSTYFLQIQRHLGLLLYAALAIAVLLYLLTNRAGKGRLRDTAGLPLLFVTMLAVALYPAIQTGSRMLGTHPESSGSTRVATAIKFAAHGSAMGTAKSAWYARFSDRFHEKSHQTPEAARDFSRSVVLSTWALQPHGKLDAVREHSGRLFSLSYPPDWDALLRRPDGISAQTRSALIIHIGMFGLALLGTTLISLALLLAKPENITFPVLHGTAFVVGIAFVLLLVFENKPFNIAPVWLVYPLIVGVAASITNGRQHAHRQWPGIQSLAASGVGACAIPAGGTIAWLILNGVYGIDGGRIIDRWELRLSQSETTANEWETQIEQLPTQAFDPKHYVHDRRSFVLRDAPLDARRIHKRANSLYFTLQLPRGRISKGDSISAIRSICPTGSRRTLEFFMFAPYARQDVDEAFRVDVRVDEDTVKRLPVPHSDRSDTMQLISIPEALDGKSSCHTLSFTLISNVDRTARSWADASHVEIWFPRLVN